MGLDNGRLFWGIQDTSFKRGGLQTLYFVEQLGNLRTKQSKEFMQTEHVKINEMCAHISIILSIIHKFISFLSHEYSLFS